jgi:hypothetical protein
VEQIDRLSLTVDVDRMESVSGMGVEDKIEIDCSHERNESHRCYSFRLVKTC